MKVSELIEHLQQFDDDDEVVTVNYQEFNPNIEVRNIEVYDTKVSKWNPETKQHDILVVSKFRIEIEKRIQESNLNSCILEVDYEPSILINYSDLNMDDEG